MFTYDQAIDYIFGLINYEKMSHNRASQNYDPRRIKLLMEKLGNPQLLYKTIHVAGTKGKGSTASMIASCLSQAYEKVGLYTSPHLVSPCERISLNGVMISENDLATTVTEIAPVIDAINAEEKYGRVTTFETLTALAFVYFAKKQVDYAVIEVGLGGRLDATNVVLPEVSVLTTIALDHTDVLGDTLEKIATEKSGIIKDGIPVVSACQVAEAFEVIHRTAESHYDSLFQVGTDASFQVINRMDNDATQHIVISGLLSQYDVHLPLLGDFQAKNATLAVLALEVLNDIRITPETIEKGLGTTKWNGRFQIINRTPKIVIDGAHNIVSSEELAQALTVFKDISPRCLVIGLSDDKDYQGVLNNLLPFFDYVVLTKADNPRALNPQVLRDYALTLGAASYTAESVVMAIEKAKNILSSHGLICVTGSLFVAGEALAYLA